MYTNIDVNVLSLITKYIFDKKTAKIECGNYIESCKSGPSYKVCTNTTELITTDDIDTTKLLPISLMKKEQECIIPCGSCSKLSLKATQCKLLHGSKYMARCCEEYLSWHEFCTKCDSKSTKCQGLSCEEKLCNIPHYENEENYSCDNCGNPWLCSSCVLYQRPDKYFYWGNCEWRDEKSRCGTCDYCRSLKVHCDICGCGLCKKCICSHVLETFCGSYDHLYDIQEVDDQNMNIKPYRRQRFKNKFIKSKRRNKSKLKTSSYWKNKNDRKCNKLSMIKWNKRYSLSFIEY